MGAEKKVTIEGAGYESAKDAARAYLEAFSKSDVDAMISTFAVESYVENYDLEAQIKRVKAFIFYTFPQSLLPNNQFATALNIQQRQGQIVTWIRLQYELVLFQGELSNSGMIINLSNDKDMRSFINKLNDQTYYEPIKSLRVLGFEDPDSLSDMYPSIMNQQNIDKFREIIGAQRLEDVVARVEFDNEVYLVCFDVARYGGKWYINSIGGNIGNLIGIPATGGGIIPESDLP